jgi:ribonuclease BN (tRNA processing enzyme)
LFEAARGIDYLIHDASAPSRYFKKYPALYNMHTSARDLGRLSEEAAVRCLIPCHFLGELAFSLSEIRKEIRREFKGRLIIPRDLRKIAL